MIKLTDQSVIDIYDHLLLGYSKKTMSVKRLHHIDDEEQDNNSWHSVALWIENSQALLPWLMSMLAGGFAAGLIWISFNKIMLNKLMTTRGIYEGADS